MTITIGIKIVSKDAVAKSVSIVRNIERLTVSEAQRRILSDEYVLSYDLADEEGVIKIITCYNELSKHGISTELYRMNELVDIEYVHNLCDWYELIGEQVKAESDEESE